MTRGGSVQLPVLSSVGGSALPGNPVTEEPSEQDQAGHQENVRASRAAAPVHNSLQWSLFNATASFLGLPGLVSPVDGLRDEGAGFHADGTTRRVGGSDSTSGSANFDGRRASSYASAGFGMGRDRDWLYGNMFGDTVDDQGRVWSMGNQYSGARRNSYGQTLNPGDNIFNSVLQRGFSAGMGFANSAVESSILGLMGSDSPYGNGKARLNFMWYLDENGKSRFGGEGDVLWPLYDSLHTTIYTQFGARSMFSGGDDYGPDRWVGNIGVGQRWFPGASLKDDGKTVDSGNWMFGYNAFYDHDITRGHQRGGVGLEAQYDWLKVATNYYAPLSGWKGSKDFDGNFVQERAAQGWDLRVKGYVPFYREIAITGAYTQWYGDHVGMFGPSKLEKAPKIWAYGVEYTPIPAMTAFVNQRQTERGRADTELGLRFTYNFGMSAEEQFKPSRVAEMRTVHGARHDFVNRENKIILEYRTKNRFRIEFAGFDGGNTFSFRLRDGFGKAAAGQVVRVTAGGYVTVASAAMSTGHRTFVAHTLEILDSLLSVRSAHADAGMSYTADANGTLRVRVDNPGKLDFLGISVGETTTSFTRQTMGLGPKTKAEAKPDKTDVDGGGTASIRITNAAYNAKVDWKVEGMAATPGGTPGAGSISGGSQTDAQGNATATFTPSQTGGVRITATVGGETTVCELMVKADAYAVTATPLALTQLAPQDVTFTVTKNGAATDGIAVNIAANANVGLAGSQATTTDSGGKFTLALKPTANAASTESLKLNIPAAGAGTEFPLAFTVKAHSLQLVANPTSVVAGSVSTITLSNAPVGEAVTWAVDDAAKGTLSNQQTTVQPGGTVTATLTGTTEGSVVVTATLGGVTKSATVTVTATATVVNYTLEATPLTLTQNAATSVTFTVKANGAAVGSSTNVSIAAKAELGVTAQNISTNANGQFTLNLTATTAGNQALMATVDGKAVSVTFTVTPAPTVLTLAADNAAQTYPIGVMRSGEKFTLADGGTALGSGVSVTLTYSGAGAFDNPPASANTAAGGKIALNLQGKTAGVVTITATANGKSATTTLTVTPAPLSITTTSPLPNVIVNTAYSQTIAATGGTLPYTFSVASGSSLPAGLTLSNGVISGTPTAAGDFTFIIEVRDAASPTGVTASQSFALKVADIYTVSFGSSSYSPAFVKASDTDNKASQAVVITVTNAASQPVSGATVTLAASMNGSSNPAIISSMQSQFYGLKVNGTDGNANFPAPAVLTTSASGQVTVNLEDIVGERTLTLTASATPAGGAAASASATVAFGAGPLAALRLPTSSPDAPGTAQWADTNPIGATTSFPAANMCGGTGDTTWNSDAEHSDVTHLPTQAELQAVSGSTGNGAGLAAGWPPSTWCWMGRLLNGRAAYVLSISTGEVRYDGAVIERRVVCRR